MAVLPKCKLFFVQKHIINQTGELVLLFVTVIFRFLARNKIAELEVVRLFLESASPGPSGGVRAIT